VTGLTRDDLVTFHETWFKPNNATLVIVGATTMDEIKPKLERLFGSWAEGRTPLKNIVPVAHRSAPAAYIVDRPGSMQSLIFAGHVAPPKSNPKEVAIETMNNILGGLFTSRINMNLREDKHWCYGAQTLLYAARGQRPFICYASVQSDKTKESIVEIDRELRGISGQRPVTADELAKAQSSQTLELPGSWETISAIGGSIGDIVRFDLPADYFELYPARVRALTLADISSAAGEVIHADNLVWVVVGDRSRIETGVRELGYGEVHFIDTDGDAVV
jgi:zinc protease